MSSGDAITAWLKKVCAEYEFDIVATYRRGGEHEWPITAKGPQDLERQLEEGGHFIPLPKEPAALANQLEVSLVDFILEKAQDVDWLNARRGTERGYPDIELETGEGKKTEFFAVDIKVAKRAKSGNKTQSRITLYTGNTYFRYPKLKWSGTFRPFADYSTHLDVLGIYTLDSDLKARITDLELIVAEPWQIASRQRSSTTREYIGAVTNLEALRAGKGEFSSPDEFYRFWRKFPFVIGRAVQQQLDRLLAERD